MPLAVCALIITGVALYRMNPPKRSVPFDALLADVLALAEAGRHYDAADAAANLLELEPPLPMRERAVLHRTLADIIYRQEILRGLPNRKNAELLLKHHQAAMALGRRPDGRAAVQAGQAHEWLGQPQHAMGAYRTALKRELTAEARRTALQGLVRLLEGKPQAATERRGYIQALLEEEGISPAYGWWALQHVLQEPLDDDGLARAREVLTDHGQRFQRSDLKGYYDYLWARLHVCEGQTERAAPLLDRVEQWLASHPSFDPALDRAGFLPAMVPGLRGRIHLDEARPQAALACFEQALALQPHDNLFVVATIGKAQALAMLERHGAARQVLRDAPMRLEGDPLTLSIALPRMREATRKLLRSRHEQHDHENAVAYLELALELTPTAEPEARLDLLEQLGEANEAAAQATSDAGKRRAFYAAAAHHNEQAADLAFLDGARQASLLRASASQYDLAGRIADARRMLLRFVEGRTLDPRMPQALLQLGRAYAADGQCEQASAYYRQLAREFPRLEEAARARLLTADCLVALGEDHYAEAEGILRDLLEDEHVAPQAQVFRDALFGLCDLLFQQHQYAPAISRMEDFLVFYPEDAERHRIRFMRADAYRRSALALPADESAGSAPARLRVSRARLRHAAELFQAFIGEADCGPGGDQAQATYERLALLYRGDCLFELNEPQALDEALATYGQAAARYQGEPAALVAQVQIANIYLRQGKLTEAARAIERARWLLGSIPDHAFAEHASGVDRDDWDRYLSVIRSSQLFRHVFAEAR